MIEYIKRLNPAIETINELGRASWKLCAVDATGWFYFMREARAAAGISTASRYLIHEPTTGRTYWSDDLGQEQVEVAGERNPRSAGSFPRRARMYDWTPAEKGIFDAIQAVEAMGADPRLTDAVVLLGYAKDRVADFVDGAPGRAILGLPDRPMKEVASDADGA